jgi:hypothetical protein
MQLKIKRSQRDGGIVSKTAIFCLDARVDFAPQEQASLTRYKLANQVIYNSEASKRLLDQRDAAHASGTTGGYLKSMGLSLMAATKLNITVSSLQRGQHIECKSLDELLGAEEALMLACQNLKVYLDTAATFDGREVLFNFDSGEPEVAATAVSPQPALAASSAEATVASEARVEALPASGAAASYESPAQDRAYADYAPASFDIDERLEVFGRWVRDNPALAAAGAFVALVFLLLLF